MNQNIFKCFLNLGSKCQPVQCVRHLHLLEYHSHNLLKSYNINVPNFRIVDIESQNNDLKRIKDEFKVDEYVIKAQILAGGRGLGHFENGTKGGVQLTKEHDKVLSIIASMLGHRLITKQTTKDGLLVKKVMVAESNDIIKETYVSILLDPNYENPIIVASPSGGTDIEEIAKNTPHLLRIFPVDILDGLDKAVAKQVAEFLKFEGIVLEKATEEIMKLWDAFTDLDAVQLEINPFVETSDHRIVCIDAKILYDDNAKFRQEDIFKLKDNSNLDPQEVIAAENDLQYIKLDGNIGCLVNGAGLAMATMDLLKHNGGEPANFFDLGGGVREEQMEKAFKIITSDKNIKSILVNVFGGIVNCATIAKGIIKATKTIKLDKPLIVRLEGTNRDEGRMLLENSKLDIKFASSFDEAAKLAVTVK